MSIKCYFKIDIYRGLLGYEMRFNDKLKHPFSPSVNKKLKLKDGDNLCWKSTKTSIVKYCQIILVPIIQSFIKCGKYNFSF